MKCPGQEKALTKRYYSTNTVNLQIQVTGWRTYTSNEYCLLRYNYEYVDFTLQGSNSNTNNWSEWSFIIIPMDLRPHQSQISPTYDANMYIRVSMDNGKVSRKKVSDGDGSNGRFFCNFLWKRRTFTHTKY